MKVEIPLSRGLYTDMVDIRRKVFVEIAKLFWQADYHNLSLIKEEVGRIPYRVINKADPTYRCCVYRERAIVQERVRLALGLPRRHGEFSGPASEGIEQILKPEKVRTHEIVRVIPEACEKCPSKAFRVTSNCRQCIAHPCTLVCPARAFDLEHHSPRINGDKCIRCGLCEKACPYNAIVKFDRPCAVACGVKAIGSDQTGRACIDYDKCVRCGMCIVACPFGAIADESEFAQMIMALRDGIPMYAIVAPAFVGQFGPFVSPGQILAGIRRLGFRNVFEVAFGADVATVEESEEWYKKVIVEKQPFLGTSCCPAWVDMARKEFPEEAENISHSYTPMATAGKRVKERFPEARVTFIGPCTAKKSECLRPELDPYIDFVITFEELAAIFVAADIDLVELAGEAEAGPVSGSGRNYAVCGGVAAALKMQIEHHHPEASVVVASADSLADCRTMLKRALSKELEANLIEGMACPGGCVGGPGILSPIRKATAEIEKFSRNSSFRSAWENPDLKDKGE
ncbi:MAG: 4Fe-4S binding protein [Candidatus Riflebacteria bacterium]|nr:4Fe-4S binding protein [Candidatus Riflebacteria bacterium]